MALRFCRGHVAAFGERIQACAIQQLRAIDIADAREHGLVHQQHADGRFGAQDAIEGRLRVVAVECVGAETVEQRLPLGVGPELAGGGAAEFEPVDVARAPESSCRRRRSTSRDACWA